MSFTLGILYTYFLYQVNSMQFLTFESFILTNMPKNLIIIALHWSQGSLEKTTKCMEYITQLNWNVWQLKRQQKSTSGTVWAQRFPSRERFIERNVVSVLIFSSDFTRHSKHCPRRIIADRGSARSYRSRRGPDLFFIRARARRTRSTRIRGWGERRPGQLERGEKKKEIDDRGGTAYM